MGFEMQRTELGMGLHQYLNDHIALVGGFRSGSSLPHMTRLRYDVYDLRGFDPKEPDKSRAGFVELFVSDEDNHILGLVNIELDKSKRRAGIGKLVIRSIRDTAPGDLRIYDIRPKAKSFWQAIGTEIKGRDGVLRK